jgi:hypothetical protein
VPARRSLVAIERCTGAWILILLMAFLAISALPATSAKAETLRYHTLVLDDENKTQFADHSQTHPLLPSPLPRGKDLLITSTMTLEGPRQNLGTICAGCY